MAEPVYRLREIMLGTVRDCPRNCHWQHLQPQPQFVPLHSEPQLQFSHLQDALPQLLASGVTLKFLSSCVLMIIFFV